MPEPLMYFESHTVAEDVIGRVYADRLEWESTRRASRRRRSFHSDTLPIAEITDVTTRRDGLRHTIMAIGFAGRQVVFRVHGEEAGPLRHMLDELRADAHPSQRLAEFAPAPTAPGGWHADPHGRHEFRYWNGTGWTEHVWDHGVGSRDPVG